MDGLTVMGMLLKPVQNMSAAMGQMEGGLYVDEKASEAQRQALGKRLRDIPELKAAGGDPRLVQKVLRHAVDTGFEAIAAILDKKRFPQPIDPEGLYRYACAQAVQNALEQQGPLSLTLDRRYKTAGPRQHTLEQALRAGAAEAGISLELRHEDSRREPALQVADAVCWASSRGGP